MDEVTFCSPQDYFVVNTLSAVLKDVRQSTEPLSRLTLSARCLQVLYEGFRQIQSSSCVKLSHMDLEQNVFQSLSHLLNIVQNAKELKIFENGETLQGHVNCTDFGSISSLEVKCLPLYQLYGLSKVAANLTNVTCIGCLTRIQELFEQCGADTFRASDVLWSKLNEVHLSYNNLQSLDNSLRLVSNLTHLDLSHNSLTSTDNFLMVLDKLKTLNLSYNSLRTFPEISNAANRHLTSLNLRNNLLTSTEGLERLFCLVSLDLSNNLLPASRTLTYLKPLLLLQCLVLNGNPVSFHPSYRKIVVGSLHPAVISQITFDGHYLTRKEKQQFDQVNASNVSIFTRSEFNDSIDSALSILDSMSDSQRRSGRRRRPRIVEIPTHDDSLPDERFETSVDFCDSPLPFSAHSSSGHDRDATGSERCDSGLRLPRLQTSSRSSSSRRSISRLKQSLSATVLAGTPTSTSDGVRNNVEITGNRICFVENKDTDGSTPLAGGNTGNGVFLLNAIEKVQREVAGRCDGEVGNEVPVASLKPADDVRGITRGTSSTDESGFVSTLDSSLTANDASVTVQDVTVVVENELSADNADYNELSANNADNYNQPANNAVPSIEDLSDGVAQSSLHGSPQDVAQDSNLVSTAGVNANSTNSNSFDHDTYSSRPPAADVTRLRRAAPLHISRSFSCAAPQANTARSYDKFRSDSFERNGGGNRNSPFDAKSFEQDLTAEDLEVGSPATEEVTLDDLLENGFEGDFLIYVVEGPPNTTSDGKCIVSVIDNWLYVRSAKEVIERLDLRNLQAVQKVTDQLSDFAAKRGGKIVVDPEFPGPVVRLLFDTFKKDNRERFFSVRSQDQGKQLARLLKSFIKTKNSKKMQCLRCDSHFDESEGTVVHKDITEVNVKPASSFQASRNSVLHCPKCDSHFVIEVSDKTGMDSARDSLTQSMCVKSQTMSKLDREHSFSRSKDHSKHKKRRKQKRGSLALLSSSVSSSTGTPGSLPGSQLFSSRRSTIAEPSLEGSDLSRTFDDDEAYEALPDDATAINAVKFYFEDQNN